MTSTLRSLAHTRPTLFRHFIALLIAIFSVALATLHSSAGAQILLKNSASSSTASAVVQTEQVRAELVAHAPQGVAPGSTVWVGLQLQHQPQWHTYWKNPGDSGLPTVLQWTLPAGVTAGEIAWPTPRRIAVGSLANYGFEGTVLLPVPLTVDSSFKPTVGGALEVKLSASWLVCRQECIPQQGEFVLHLPTRSSTAMHAADFEANHSASPQAFAGSAQATIANDALTVTVRGLPASWSGHALQAFPETPNVTEPVSSPQEADKLASQSSAAGNGVQVWNQNVWTGHFPLSALRETSPDRLPVVLAMGAQSLRTEVAISGAWPRLETPGAGAAQSPPAGQEIPVPGNAGSAGNASISGSGTAVQGLGTWGFALVAALLGGLILNLMPCVLPVLAIKVLGFTRRNADSRAAQRAQGLAYTAGVMLSFVGLGALMLALRASGEQLGWGFQLQSPAVVSVLAALFTLVGLNLAGLFEVGSVLPHSVAGLQARHPAADAFLSGVLAVAVASPCTAPFMGASLGYAISLPALQALGIFAALGLGLALPFLAAAWIPSVGNWLPRPGAWMDTLRRFMAFPMFATVVWLVWVLGHLSGVDGAGALLALLLALSLLIWSLNLTGRSRTVFAVLSLTALAGVATSIGPLALKMEDAGAAALPTGTATPAGAASGISWQAWAPGKVEAELAAGHPVFVDFTAAWCITCQYNKKTTLANADVLNDLRTHQVTLLRADWTRRDPAITQALEQLGRSGVPVYVLHQAGKPPVVFSEILDAQALREKLAQL